MWAALVIAVVATIRVATIGTAYGKPRERVAVIDLGPDDEGASRRTLATAIVDGGLEAVIGDGIEDALAGQASQRDAATLASALADAQRAFGALDCKTTIASGMRAVGIAAARQAAGLPVPELARAWTYVLLCADRSGDPDTALFAATHLRALGGTTDVPADVWARYPEVDTLVDPESIPVEIVADVPGATIWIDFARAGTSPLKTTLRAGRHVIAAASGTKRGWAAGTAVKAQPLVPVAMHDQNGTYGALAQRVAGWKGTLPSPAELGLAFDAARVRVALVRKGERLEAWGRSGKSEAPRRLGGDDGTGTLAEAARLVALINDRVTLWNDRAPDPDVPLLVEDPKPPRDGARADTPTKWWVYAALVGAVAASATVLYVYDSGDDIQRVELHYP
ncbi:MAG: hypothetical protein SFX73_19290 [Kofleriaceae bacterium]|nr:hypothetical protein [Kofleriaceae bacterium]